MAIGTVDKVPKTVSILRNVHSILINFNRITEACTMGLH